MTHADDSAREMAKWAHDRTARESQQTEDAQRVALAQLAESGYSAVTGPDVLGPRLGG
jgi:hypothetical protein